MDCAVSFAVDNSPPLSTFSWRSDTLIGKPNAVKAEPPLSMVCLLLPTLSQFRRRRTSVILRYS